jgi:hypothetical protein
LDFELKGISRGGTEKREGRKRKAKRERRKEKGEKRKAKRERRSLAVDAGRSKPRPYNGAGTRATAIRPSGPDPHEWRVLGAEEVWTEAGVVVFVGPEG